MPTSEPTSKRSVSIEDDRILINGNVDGLRSLTGVANQLKTSINKRNFMMTVRRSATIVVEPSEVLVDEKVAIRVTGLEVKQKVTIKTIVREGKVVFAGCACFEAGDDGQIDVTRQRSLSGTYTGIDSMGLVWSMQQSPGQKEGLRLSKKNVTTPQIVDIALYNGHLSFNEVHKESLTSLTKTQLTRWYKEKEVKRIPVKQGQIRGTLFLPPGEGPFPGVIDIFGVAGGLIEFRASLLASKGYAVLALAYFGYDDLPSSYDNLSLDYLKEAVEFVCTHPYVKSGGIGLIGVSRGAEYCQLMAMHCDEVKAVVSINGVPALSQFSMRNGSEILETKRPMKEMLSNVKYVDEKFIIKGVLVLENHDFFKLWERDCKLLNIAGGDDQWADCCIQQLQYDTYPEDQRHKIELVVYPGAGHLIEPPYSPLMRATYTRLFQGIVLNGGRPKEHAYAQEDAWKRIQKFFKENLPSKIIKNSKL